jgi:hypothetical protein
MLGDGRGQALPLAVGPRGAAFGAAGLAMGQLLVETPELALGRLDGLLRHLDRGIGVVLLRALRQRETGVVMVGIAFLDVLDGILRGTPRTAHGGGDALGGQAPRTFPAQDAGAVVAAQIPDPPPGAGRSAAWSPRPRPRAHRRTPWPL